MELKNLVLEKSRKYFNSESNYSTDKNGNIEVEVYTDYNDVLDISIIKEAFKKDSKELILGFLQDHIYNCYIDHICDLEMDISHEVFEYINRTVDYHVLKEVDSNYQLDDSYIRGVLNEEGIMNVYVDTKDIIKRSTVNIITNLESENSINHEFGLNDFDGDLVGWIEDIEEKISKREISENDISLIVLLKSQGYTLQDFKNEATKWTSIKAYRCRNKFFESLVNECYNTTSPCNALVFTQKYNLYEYLTESNELKVSKGTSCGYVDFVYGGGSVVGISLEKDVDLTYIHNNKYIDDKVYGYSFQEIYGEFIS